MSSVTYDTSAFIAYQPSLPRSDFLLSSVVLQELTAGATDKAGLRYWEAIYHRFKKEQKLLVPDDEDWWLAGKVLNALLRGLKSKAGGQTPKLPAAEKQRIIRDVLIARTAKRAGALLVTDNLDDFNLIRRFCAVPVISGAEYFG